MNFRQCVRCYAVGVSLNTAGVCASCEQRPYYAKYYVPESSACQPLEVLTEERVRQIVREELARASDPQRGSEAQG